MTAVAIDEFFARRQAYAAEIREIYADAERRMLTKVAKRIARGIDNIKEPGWAERKLAEIHALNREIQGDIVDLRKLDPKIADVVEAAWKDGADKAAEDLIKTKLTEIHPPTEEALLTRGQQMRVAGQETVSRLAEMLNRAIPEVDRAYHAITLRASNLALTGALTGRQAAQVALDEFADKGITFFIDKLGRRWDIASYAECKVRTDSMNAYRDANASQLQDMGHDLVIVSTSSESCDICEPWEGQVCSLSGNSDKYPALEEAKSDGLFHNNCTHVTGIYIECITPPMDMIPASEKHDNYEEKQQQRYLERGVRQWKNRGTVAISDDAKQKADGKVKEWQGRLRTFTEDTGRRRDYGRESITRAR